MEKIAIYSLVALVLFTRLSDVVSSPSTDVSGHGVVEASAAGTRAVKLKLSLAGGVPKRKSSSLYLSPQPLSRTPRGAFRHAANFGTYLPMQISHAIGLP